MAWADIDPRLRTVAEQVCTRAELEVLALLAEDLSLRQIARRLGITRQAVQGRWKRAERRIQHEVAFMRGYDTGR